MTNSNTRLAFVLAAAPTLAFVLHDFVFQLPDNEGDVTTGFLLTAAGLLCLWAASGYIAARVPRSSAAAIGAGALMAAISVAMGGGAVSLGVVQATGGRWVAANDGGGGARFDMRLPLAR